VFASLGGYERYVGTTFSCAASSDGDRGDDRLERQSFDRDGDVHMDMEMDIELDFGPDDDYDKGVEESTAEAVVKSSTSKGELGMQTVSASEVNVQAREDESIEEGEWIRDELVRERFGGAWCFVS